MISCGVSFPENRPTDRKKTWRNRYLSYAFYLWLAGNRGQVCTISRTQESYWPSWLVTLAGGCTTNNFRTNSILRRESNSDERQTLAQKTSAPTDIWSAGYSLRRRLGLLHRKTFAPKIMDEWKNESGKIRTLVLFLQKVIFQHVWCSASDVLSNGLRPFWRRSVNKPNNFD